MVIAARDRAQLPVGVRRIGQYAFVTSWDWANRNYKKHPNDAEWLLREALRRAIDIRDVSGSGEPVSGRPAKLVDVLNALKDAMGLDPDANGWSWLWSETE